MVAAGAAAEEVVAVAAAERVVARAAEEGLVAARSDEEVVPCAAKHDLDVLDDVVALARLAVVRGAVAGDEHGGGAAAVVGGVDAALPGEAVGADASVEGVVAV